MPKRKLLLADDSITIQKVVNLTFADEGIEVVSVGDGNSAMDKLRDDAPDIVLADVNMPGLSGYEICAQIKGRSFDDQIPVVLLVGSFEPFDEEEAERVGADGYLTKPFQSINQLVSKVSELLGDAPGQVAEKVSDNSIFETNPPSYGLDSSQNQDLPGFGNATESNERFADLGEDYSEDDVTTADLKANSDEAEMSQAFAGDPVLESADSEFNDDDQIEEVTDDFLKTQPLTPSDLREIALDDDHSHVASTDSDSSAEETTVTEPLNPFVPVVRENSLVDEEAQELTAVEETVNPFVPTDRDREIAKENETSRDEAPNPFEPFARENSFEEAATEGKESVNPFVPSDRIPEVAEENKTANEEPMNPFIAVDRSADTAQEADADSVGFELVREDKSFESNFVALEDANSGLHPRSEGSVADSGSELPMPEGASVLDLDGFDGMNLLELPPIEKRDDPVAGILESPNEEFETDTDHELHHSEPPTSFEKHDEVSQPGRAPSFEEEVASFDIHDTFQPVSGGFVEPELGTFGFKDDADSEQAPPDSTDTRQAIDNVLSKEMVEAITQRVIETLSERAIKEIAWEVVPDMADLILRQMAKEKMKD